MDQEFFTNLPSEIVIDILARLPVRSIIICKCVCETWLNLLGTHEFAKFHLSRSVPGLAVCHTALDSRFYEIFEFEDDLDLEHHEHHYRLVTKFKFHGLSELNGSANGLLFLCHPYYRDTALYICNPVTRDYIELHCPKERACSHRQLVTYGFGASKMTGKHKVVRISHCHTRHECISDEEMHEFLEATKSRCHVYTLGTGSWRLVALGDSLVLGDDPAGVFVNGNLHWLVYDSNDSPLVSCFDLETELFSTFSCPCLPGSRRFGGHLSALGDCLCYCDDTFDDGIVIWLMNLYGFDKSWTKEFVTRNFFFGGLASCNYPIKVFKDGDILMARDAYPVFMFCHSTKTKATQKIDMFEQNAEAILHTPSFLSLESFGPEVMNLIEL